MKNKAHGQTVSVKLTFVKEGYWSIECGHGLLREPSSACPVSHTFLLSVSLTVKNILRPNAKVVSKLNKNILQ